MSSDYQGWPYDDRGLGIKLARLQAGGEMLHRKAARLTQLAATALLEVRAQLEEMIAVLDAHRTAVGAESGKINRELEFHFAHQVTDYAAALAHTAAGVGRMFLHHKRRCGTRSNPHHRTVMRVAVAHVHLRRPPHRWRIV